MDKSGAPVVLVVDDDPSLRLVLSMTLREEGYEVVEASSGEAALALAEHGSFSLVLLDNRMPGLCGIDVVRALRARPATETLPVLLVTAADDLSERVSGLDAGATDYITKPFEIDELLARVRTQLRGQHAWRELINRQLSERAMVAEALGRAIGQPTPELMAAAICQEMVLMTSVTAAGLVWLSSDRVATPLAAEGDVWGMRAGEPLPPALAKYLCMRSAIGPWIEEADTDLDDKRSPGTLLVSGTVACAPLGGRTDPLGVLLLSVEPEASTADVATTLAAAIDLAGVVASLLHQPLQGRQADRARRAGLTSLLEQGAFTPYFQPIRQLNGDHVVGFEALTRFSDGSGPQGRFAEAARLGLGIELEQATITAALESAAALPERRWLSINVSPAMILERDALRHALSLTDREIVLELTEHERVDDYEALRLALDALGRDILLSVDDAGSGFASLRHILILSPAFVKLDRTWIHNIDSDPARQALVAGLRDFASKTGCRLIAEGVENETERLALAALGVDLGQGFLLGVPAPVSPGSVAPTTRCG